MFVRTDAEGRFWIDDELASFESARDDSFVLVASSESHVSVRRSAFERGDFVRHEVEGVGLVDGRVEVIGEHWFDHFFLEVESEEAWRSQLLRPRATLVDELGGFSLTVPPGDFGLRLFGQNAGGFGTGSVELLAELRDLRVDPLRVTRPDQLDPWRVEVRAHAIEVVAANGEPVGYERATLIYADGSSRSVRIWNGVLRVHSPNGRVDAWLEIGGSMSEYVSDLHAHDTIVLQPPAAARFTVVADDWTLPDDAQIGVRLSKRRPEPVAGVMNTACVWTNSTFDRVASLDGIGSTGEWTATLFVRRRGGPSLGEFGEARTVSIHGGPRAQSVTLRLGESELAEAAALLAADNR